MHSGHVRILREITHACQGMRRQACFGNLGLSLKSPHRMQACFGDLSLSPTHIRKAPGSLRRLSLCWKMTMQI